MINNTRWLKTKRISNVNASIHGMMPISTMKYHIKYKRFNPIEQLKDNVYYFVVVDIVP